MENSNSKLMETRRIGYRLADQVKFQKEEILGLQEYNRKLESRAQDLDNEVQSLRKAKVTMIRDLNSLKESEERRQVELVHSRVELAQALKTNELLREELSDLSHRVKEVERESRHKTSQVNLEAEEAAKECVHLRMYVSRLEAEVDLARRSVAEMTNLRKSDAITISQLRDLVEEHTRRCQHLQTQVMTATARTEAIEGEKQQLLASFAVERAEKDTVVSTLRQSVKVLEDSLHAATNELSAGEKAADKAQTSMCIELAEKVSQILELEQKYAGAQAVSSELRKRIDRLQIKYEQCKQSVRQLLEVVETYEVVLGANIALPQLV